VEGLLIVAQMARLPRTNHNRGLIRLTVERDWGVDPLRWLIALALCGIIGGMIVILAG